MGAWDASDTFFGLRISRGQGRDRRFAEITGLETRGKKGSDATEHFALKRRQKMCSWQKALWIVSCKNVE
jgi:hypothetical protein